MLEILSLLLRAPATVEVANGAAEWWRGHERRAAQFAHPADVALAGGFAADRLGWAFASGYQAAADRLFGHRSVPAALCATESGGNHPRAIATTLAERDGGLRVDGEKSFVSLGGFARALYVVVRVSTGDDGRPILKIVRVESDRPGVVITPQPPTPFVPEVPHARIELVNVAVSPEDVLPGDGYSDYLKPFRTVEDAHVHAALVGWLVGVGRRAGWPDATLERLAAHAVLIRDICAADANRPEVHVALAGTMTMIAELADEPERWAAADVDTRTRWNRDRALLSIASKARAARRTRAWERLRGSR